MDIPQFEKDILIAGAGGILGGIVLIAEDTSGKLSYAKAFGNASSVGAKPESMTMDSAFYIASCTKIVTTIAVMQCIERGLLTLDEDGFDKDTAKPILTNTKNTLTLRHLLTHSSGLSYDHFHPDLQRYRVNQNYPHSMNRHGMSADNYLYPLLFEPGTSFTYGASIDWAGIMVERVNNGTKMEEYMQKNVWEPLGIKDMTFHLERKEGLHTRLVSMSTRESSDPQNPAFKIVHTDHFLPDPAEDNLPGHGLISTAVEFQKILSSLCANDGRLLRPKTADEMFSPHLTSSAQKALQDYCKCETGSSNPGLGRADEMDWGLGGILNLGVGETGRKKHALAWTGMPNCFWWIDREAGISGVCLAALLPPGDGLSKKYYNAFERAMYKQLSK